MTERTSKRIMLRIRIPDELPINLEVTEFWISSVPKGNTVIYEFCPIVEQWRSFEQLILTRLAERKNPE